LTRAEIAFGVAWILAAVRRLASLSLALALVINFRQVQGADLVVLVVLATLSGLATVWPGPKTRRLPQGLEVAIAAGALKPNEARAMRPRGGSSAARK
jgi:hypothetical protein